MTEKLPEKAIAFCKGASLQFLRKAGIDPKNIDAEARAKIDADMGLTAAAVVCGLIEPPINPSLEQLIEKANQDPLLWKYPEGEEMEVCKRRGRLMCWIAFGFGPKLTEDDQRVLDVVCAVDIPLFAGSRILRASLSCSDEDLIDIAGKPTLPEAEPYQREWIKNIGGLMALIPEDRYFEVETSISKLFGDGLPMTIDRWNAWQSAENDYSTGMFDVNLHNRRILN